MFLLSIPDISDEEIQRRYQKVKPVICVNGDYYSFKDFSLKELKESSYLWNSKLEKLCHADLYSFKDFICIHKIDPYGFFKPTLSEILSQLDDADIEKAVAFEIVERPKSYADFQKDVLSSIAFNQGYCVSTVRLYR